MSAHGYTIDGGLTVFCPLDDTFKAFLPKFKNLTASGKVSLLQFFGVPVYQSLAMLKSNNGIMNTLATNGDRMQNEGEDVTLKTRGTTAKIVGTLIDEQPLAIYSIDKHLPRRRRQMPQKSSKHKKPSADDAPSDSPADSPDGDAADQTADDNASVRLDGGRLVAMVLSLCLGLLQLKLCEFRFMFCLVRSNEDGPGSQ
ncbi:hypothetical protein NC652_003800 [Populus alba x Populus x berolinensis]|nr:hypothetical protein NC652_003800 [Populus alba x Populus x berolinensis]